MGWFLVFGWGVSVVGRTTHHVPPTLLARTKAKALNEDRGNTYCCSDKGVVYAGRTKTQITTIMS